MSKQEILTVLGRVARFQMGPGEFLKSQIISQSTEISSPGISENFRGQAV